MFFRYPSDSLQNDEIFLWNPENIGVLDGKISTYQQQLRFQPKKQWIMLIGYVYLFLMSILLGNPLSSLEGEGLHAVIGMYVTQGYLLVFFIVGVCYAIYYGIRWLNVQRLRRHGIVIYGKVDSCFVTKQSSHYGYSYQVDLIGGFYAPNGNYIRYGGGTTLSQSDYESKLVPKAGDHIAVLYLDDDHFALL